MKGTVLDACRRSRVAEAGALLRERQELAKVRPVSAYDFAVVHAGWARTKPPSGGSAKRTERATGVRWLKVEPIFDALWGAQRFQELRRSVGLPD